MWQCYLRRSLYANIKNLDRYKTYKICNDAVADCLGALKFIPDGFVTSKILEKFHDALLANDILFFDENLSKVTFFADEMGILGVDMMTIIFMKMILILILMKTFGLV